MWKRLALIAALSTLPLSALADDSTPTAAGANDLQSQQSGATQSQTGQDATGGSSADATALQPAGSSPINLAPTGTTGLGASATDSLQAAPSTNDGQLRVLLNNEADGAPQSLAEPDSSLPDGLAIVVVLLGAGGVWLLRRQQLRRARARYPHYTHHQPQPNRDR
ncbi:MAG TPA: hypothetical protein VLI05_04730 [Candidatus Saccharimonadia bacterium]|nr:hypothetical protein [Candidatus Saccharimonadia bacterium]